MLYEKQNEFVEFIKHYKKYMISGMKITQVSTDAFFNYEKLIQS